MRLYVFIGILFFISFNSIANDKFVIIINSQNTQKIDKKLIKNIASDIISTWSNGQPITLYFPKSQTEVRRNFTLDILGISANQDAINWENKKITNTLNNKAPKLLRDKMIIRMVAKHPNSLGYVSPDAIKNNPNIKIVHLR